VPARETVHCKAKGKHALALVGSVRGRVMDLLARDENIYVLGFQQDLRRASLLTIGRGGTRPVVVAHHDGPSEPKSFLMTRDSAYFTRKANVIRMRLDSGDAQEVIHDFSESIAVAGDYVYGVSCNSKSTADTLVRVSLVTNEREPIAELPHVPVKKRASASPPCDYHYISIDDQTAFISDWAGRRIVSVSLNSKTMQEVAFAGSYPMRIVVEPNNIVFQAEGGLYRAPREGGTAERLAELAQAPFATYVADDKEFWINQSEAYADAVWIYRLARSGGKPKKLLKFEPYKGCDSPCDITSGIAVDDECIYVAHREEQSGSLFAWPKD
jgi:hypothetical protein